MGRKHCGKWRKCWLLAFSPFPTMFSKCFFNRVVKLGLCGKELYEPEKEAFKKAIVGKGENAGNQHFLLFTLMFFIPSQPKYISTETIISLSTNTSNLIQNSFVT